jgi:hypothetical protein
MSDRKIHSDRRHTSFVIHLNHLVPWSTGWIHFEPCGYSFERQIKILKRQAETLTAAYVSLMQSSDPADRSIAKRLNWQAVAIRADLEEARRQARQAVSHGAVAARRG